MKRLENRKKGQSGQELNEEENQKIIKMSDLGMNKRVMSEMKRTLEALVPRVVKLEEDLNNLKSNKLESKGIKK